MFINLAFTKRVAIDAIQCTTGSGTIHEVQSQNRSFILLIILLTSACATVYKLMKAREFGRIWTTRKELLLQQVMLAQRQTQLTASAPVVMPAESETDDEDAPEGEHTSKPDAGASAQIRLESVSLPAAHPSPSICSQFTSTDSLVDHQMLPAYFWAYARCAYEHGTLQPPR